MTFANRYPDLPAVGDVVAEDDFMARDGVGRRVVASIQAVVQSQPTPGTAVPVRLAFSAAGTAGTLVDVTPGVVLAKSSVAVSGAADTNENTLATITIPANSMGPNGFLRLFLAYTFTNSANNKTLRARLGGVSGTAYLSQIVTTSNTFQASIWIGNRNAANSQVGTTNAPVIGGSTQSLTTSSVDTSAVTTLVITGQKASGSETLTLESYIAEVFYGA